MSLAEAWFLGRLRPLGSPSSVRLDGPWDRPGEEFEVMRRLACRGCRRREKKRCTKVEERARNGTLTEWTIHLSTGPA